MRRQTTRIVFFFFNDTATTEIYTLSLHDALPIFQLYVVGVFTSFTLSQTGMVRHWRKEGRRRSEEHTSELQSQSNLVCRLLLEKKKLANFLSSPWVLAWLVLVAVISVLLRPAACR